MECTTYADVSSCYSVAGSVGDADYDPSVIKPGLEALIHQHKLYRENRILLLKVFKEVFGSKPHRAKKKKRK